jgi:hypothetical protein
MIPQIEGMYGMMRQCTVKSLMEGSPIPFRSTVKIRCSRHMVRNMWPGILTISHEELQENQL